MYVGMTGKGIVTPLLNGKVRIPPPTGHFIDLQRCPLSLDIFYWPLFCLNNVFPIDQAKFNKNMSQQCKNTYFVNKKES